MDVHDYARLFRRHAALIAACVVACTALALLILARSQATYTSTAQMFVTGRDSGSDANSAYQNNLLVQQRVKSYVQLVSSTEVMRQTASALGLAVSPQDLAQHVSAENPPDTALLDVTVTAASPVDAQRLLGGVTTQFIRLVDQLERPSQNQPSLVHVTLVKTPTAPSAPDGIPAQLVVIAGVFVGLLLGVGVALVRRSLDTSLETSEAAGEALGVRALGDLPELSSRQLVVDRDPEGAAAHALRKVRSRLEHVREQPPRRLLVVGVGPQERTGPVAVNLAAAFAVGGVRTVLVEADLRHPTLAHDLDLQASSRMLDALAGHCAAEEALVPVRGRALAGRLQVLPAPELARANSTELLASEAFAKLLVTLEPLADVVLVAAAPVLTHADAEVIAPSCTAALLVVATERTPKEDAAAAVRALHQVDCVVSGVVLAEGTGRRRRLRLPRPRFVGRGNRQTREGERPVRVG